MISDGLRDIIGKKIEIIENDGKNITIFTDDGDMFVMEPNINFIDFVNIECSPCFTISGEENNHPMCSLEDIVGSTVLSADKSSEDHSTPEEQHILTFYSLVTEKGSFTIIWRGRGPVDKFLDLDISFYLQSFYIQ